jgi:hypothetical protein
MTNQIRLKFTCLNIDERDATTNIFIFFPIVEISNMHQV